MVLATCFYMQFPAKIYSASGLTRASKFDASGDRLVAHGVAFISFGQIVWQFLHLDRKWHLTLYYNINVYYKCSERHNAAWTASVSITSGGRLTDILTDTACRLATGVYIAAAKYVIWSLLEAIQL